MKTRLDSPLVGIAIVVAWLAFPWSLAARMTDYLWIVALVSMCVAAIGSMLSPIVAGLLYMDSRSRSRFENERFIMFPMLACREFATLAESHELAMVLVMSPIGLALELALLALVIPWMVLCAIFIGCAAAMGGP